MRWTIGKRLFVALTTVSLVVVGLSATAMRWNFQRGFMDYLYEQDADQLTAVAAKLGQRYRATGSWVFLRGDRRAWNDLFFEGRDSQPPPRGPGGRERGPPPGDRPPPPDPLGLRDRVTLVDDKGNVVMGKPAPSATVRRLEITVDDHVVGALLLMAPPGLTEQVDLNFVATQSRAILYVAAALLLLAALLAAFLARQLVRPIRKLAAGTHKLADGEYDEQITVVGDDELGDLARDFNQLADTLRRNQQSRRQWVSDIAHELRTPLAILSGELQAIEDGVRRFDDGTRQSLQAEVSRLQKLVSDLHELTLSDEGGLRYHLETIDIGSILEDSLTASEKRAADAGIRIDFKAPGDTCLVAGDSDRLGQVFDNLVENSLRYTDSPGQLDVEIKATDDKVTIVFADSPPGVTRDQYDRLFDRLYRVDASRNRQSGGSGLGLSICESIVEAHAGKIAARASRLGGLAIKVTLPRITDPASAA